MSTDKRVGPAMGVPKEKVGLRMIVVL